VSEVYNQIQEKIKNSSQPGQIVSLIAVSKRQSFDKIEALYRKGHRDFGENYVQELVQKAKQAELLGLKDIRWHLIGHLQSNKIKLVLPWIYCFHAVDSISIAQKLSKHFVPTSNKPYLNVFLQVNVDHEESKNGFDPEAILESVVLVSRLPNLRVCGLMAIPHPESGASAFQKMKELNELTKKYTLGQLSMGMSSDYELAIRYGATHVRIGSLLFGPRT
jgi:pyridoxal phosphate enzyme (YggS family)